MPKWYIFRGDEGAPEGFFIGIEGSMLKYKLHPKNVEKIVGEEIKSQFCG
jgi:hypothetical protein